MAKLFAFGIDPVNGRPAIDVPADWPTVVQVGKIQSGIWRGRLDQALSDLFEVAFRSRDCRWNSA